MLYFVGMDALPQFVAYGPARLSDEEKAKILEDYGMYMENIEKMKPLY